MGNSMASWKTPSMTEMSVDFEDIDVAENDHLNCLPPEILELVLLKLDIPSLMTCTRVCKSLYVSIVNESFSFKMVSETSLSYC